MRKLLLTMSVLAGATVAAASAASAAPVPHAAPVLTGPAHVQPVQYYRDGRHNDWRRREAYERHRRHEWQRHHHYRGW